MGLAAQFTDEPEEIIIIPSMIGFDHRQLARMVRVEMLHYGYDQPTLEKMIYMRENRLNYLLNQRYAEFTYQEFRALNKLFNFY